MASSRSWQAWIERGASKRGPRISGERGEWLIYSNRWTDVLRSSHIGAAGMWRCAETSIKMQCGGRKIQFHLNFMGFWKITLIFIMKYRQHFAKNWLVNWSVGNRWQSWSNTLLSHFVKDSSYPDPGHWFSPLCWEAQTSFSPATSSKVFPGHPRDTITLASPGSASGSVLGQLAPLNREEQWFHLELHRNIYICVISWKMVLVHREFWCRSLV